MDAATRQLVRARAGSRCEYCRIHEDDEPYTFHIEHIVPNRHFRWQGALAVGKTKCGRATIHVLNINAEDRVDLREVLIEAGSFPPR